MFPISFDVYSDNRLLSRHSVKNVVQEEAVMKALVGIYGNEIRQVNRVERDEDEYQVQVTFTRLLSEDLPVIEKNKLPPDRRDALRQQLRKELQEACDKGLAGSFEVEPVTLWPEQLEA